MMMKVNETEVEYNNNFQLYLDTPISNPQFFPEVFNQVTVINFTVTFEGKLFYRLLLYPLLVLIPTTSEFDLMNFTSCSKHFVLKLIK